MNVITATEIRTKMPDVIATLLAGGSIDLVHRSRIVGEIRPKRTAPAKVVSARQLDAKIKKLGFPKLTPKEIDRRYRIAMVKKHGQGFS